MVQDSVAGASVLCHLRDWHDVFQSVGAKFDHRCSLHH